jgi:hypothetical protein
MFSGLIDYISTGILIPLSLAADDYDRIVVAFRWWWLGFAVGSLVMLASLMVRAIRLSGRVGE